MPRRIRNVRARAPEIRSRAYVTILTSLLIAVGWLVLVPQPAFAWGPATHVALGRAVLVALYLVPPAVRAVLGSHPRHFLYGSIAADISLAKKYVPEGRHCHHWHVGEEILGAAGDDAMAAVGYGYLAHLAADTVAHNVFVPRRLLLTSTTQAIGHTYWEHRMDMHIGEQFMGEARKLVVEDDHSEADALFDAVLSRTLFSFRTNRRIFRGMIRFQGHDRWVRTFERVLAKSRFDLPEPTVDRYFQLSFEHVIGYLEARGQSPAGRLDPIGELNLRLAKKARRRTLSDPEAADTVRLAEAADDFFPFPDGSMPFRPRPGALGDPPGLDSERQGTEGR